MPTGQKIINNVLTKLGMNNPNGTPGAGDSAYVLEELNTMWDSWGIDEGLIYAILPSQFPLIPFQQSYSIGMGTGADLAATPPSRIYAARVVDAVSIANAATVANSKIILTPGTGGLLTGMGLIGPGVAPGTTILSIVPFTSIGVSVASQATAGGVNLTATGLDRNDLDIVSGPHYFSHNDLAAAATTPDELYPDYAPDANGNTRLYIWPVLNGNQSQWLEIDAAVPFSAWQLAVNYFILFGYQDAIEWALAFRCLPGFGAAVSQGVAQVVAAEAVKAEQRIRAMNAKNREIPPEAVMDPSTPAPQRNA